MAIDYLKNLSEQETALRYPFSTLLEKYVDGYDVIRGLIHNDGSFCRFVRTRIVTSIEDERRSEASSSHRQEPADEHKYVATMSTSLLFAAFKRRSKPTDALIVKNDVMNLTSGTIDPERLFSSGR